MADRAGEPVATALTGTAEGVGTGSVAGRVRRRYSLLTGRDKLVLALIYNDFFWALLLIKDGNRRPITAALNNLQGEFFTDINLLGAGALLAAIPTILVFLALQRHFISGLSLGATKG